MYYTQSYVLQVKHILYVGRELKHKSAFDQIEAKNLTHLNFELHALNVI